MIADTDIAEIYEALGDPRGALTRGNITALEARSDQEELDAIDKLWAIEQYVNDLPLPPRLTGKHDKKCWQRHALCLADRIRDLL